MESRSTARADRRAAAAAGEPTSLSALEWTRLVRRVLMLAFAAGIAVPLHYLWRLFRLSSPWPRIFLGTAGRIACARVRMRGTSLRRDVFYIANHLSWIDILAIGGTSGSSFIAKAEIRSSPIVGWLATLNRTVFVSRENRMGVAEQINQLREALAQTWAVTIFPEGTTNDGICLLPFKAPLLKVLEPAPPGVMVQPVFIDFGAVGPEIAWIGEESGANNAKRILARRGSFPVTVNFLEPFHPRDFPGRKMIAAEGRRRIAQAYSQALGREVGDTISLPRPAAG